jgi:RNA polymerase sigma-70 factor (ECF subfamily)
MAAAHRIQNKFLIGTYGTKNIICKLLCFLISTFEAETGKGLRPTQSTAPPSQINHQAERLLTCYGNSVLRLAYSYLHNKDDAEDILQDTLIQFLKTQPEFETAEHEKAWMFRVAINKSKNKLTYFNIRKTDELRDELLTNETDDLSFVWDAVKQMPLKYSEVIHLFYYEGYSTAEIAAMLSKKEATVRSLLLRARSKLKDTLREVYDFEE